MSSSEKERDTAEKGLPPLNAADEKQVERAAAVAAGNGNDGNANGDANDGNSNRGEPGDGAAAEEESNDHTPAVLAHIRQNFGVMARVLEREVFRRGLINSSVEDMYSVFYLRSGALIDILRSETDPRLLRGQLLEMLFAIMEPIYGADHTRMLVAIIEHVAEDVFLFQAILSSASLEALVQRAQEYMNPQTSRSVGAGMSGGVSGNYSGVPNENVRGAQTSYNTTTNTNVTATMNTSGNTAAAVRPSYADYNNERRMEPTGDSKIVRGPNAYTESSNAPVSSQPEEEVMPMVNSGWVNAQRKQLADHDRETPVHLQQQQQQQQQQHHHHHHHHYIHHRVPFNQYPQQQHQMTNVAHHRQVVVGSGPLGLQQQQQQQQHQENLQGEPFPRVPVPQGPHKRVIDRMQHNTQDPDESHSRGLVWPGAPSSTGPQQDPITVPQPSYHTQNSPPTPTPHLNHHQHHHHHHHHLLQHQHHQLQHQHHQLQQPQPQPQHHQLQHQHHQIQSPNSPTHSRLLVQHRHAVTHFVPPASMSKQPSPHSTAQVTPQLTPQPPAATPLPNSQRIVVQHHHHHHHHHLIHQHQQQQQPPPPQQQQQPPSQLPHELPLQHSMMPRVSTPPHSNYQVMKHEPVAPPESKPTPTHNVEAAATGAPIRPHFHHHISVHPIRVPRSTSPQSNPPASVGGGIAVGVGAGAAAAAAAGGSGGEATSHGGHGLMIPTHHHSIHHAQPIRAMMPPPQQQQQYRHPTSSAAAPMSIDALSDEDMNWTSSQTTSMLPGAHVLRCFLRDHMAPEAVINALVKTSLTLDDLRAIPRENFNEQLKKELVSINHREFVWTILHPNEKPLSEKDVPEMNELRNFIHNNAIHNNMSQDGGGGEEENSATRRTRPSKTMLQVPQPRTSQSKQQQQQQQQQQTGKGGECKAVIWLSGVASTQIPSVLEEVSKYGKVLQHGTSSQRPNLLYCKLGDHKNDLQMVRKIGSAVLEEYHRVSPGDIADGVPTTPTGRPDEAEESSANKARHKVAGNAHSYPQQQQQQQQQQQHQGNPHRGSFGEGDEEDIDAEDARNHRKGLRHPRGRGRGGHHSYHPHRHSDGSSQTLCRFFTKGTCRNGEQCPYLHPKPNSNRS